MTSYHTAPAYPPAPLAPGGQPATPAPSGQLSPPTAETYGVTGDGRWLITSVPLAFHNSVPPQLRPSLTLFKDAWFWIFWVITSFSILATLVTLVVQIAMSTWQAALFSVTASVVLAAVAVWLLRKFLIVQPTPLRLALLALLWGSTSGFIVAVATSASPAMELASKLDQAWLQASFAGALPEEPSKALGVWLLLSMGRVWWTRPWHGLVAGALVGLGFELVENTLYALTFGVLDGSTDLNGALSVYLLRTVLGFGLHVMLSAMAGYGIGWAMFAGRHRGSWWRLGAVLLWGGIAVLFHGLWNAAWPMVSPVVVQVIAWIIMAGTMVVLVRRSTAEARKERDAGLYPCVTIYKAWGK